MNKNGHKEYFISKTNTYMKNYKQRRDGKLWKLK